MPEDKAFFAFYNTCDTTRFPVFKDSIIFRFRQNNESLNTGNLVSDIFKQKIFNLANSIAENQE
jgi:hypothetical protein